MKQVCGWWLPSWDNHFEKFLKRDGGNYQAAELENALQHVYQRRVAIDVGAHVGFWAKELCSRFDYVFAFEPLYTKCLQNNLSNCQNVSIEERALSSTDKTLAIFEERESENSGRSGMHAKMIGEHFHVPVCTLDNYCERHQVANIDFIKIDVEGHEREVLLGAQATIEKWKPVINFETRKDYWSEVSPAGIFLEWLGMTCISTFKKERVYAFV